MQSDMPSGMQPDHDTECDTAEMEWLASMDSASEAGLEDDDSVDSAYIVFLHHTLYDTCLLYLDLPVVPRPCTISVVLP